jgi:hypothetical protein
MFSLFIFEAAIRPFKDNLKQIIYIHKKLFICCHFDVFTKYSFNAEKIEYFMNLLDLNFLKILNNNYSIQESKFYF